MAKATKKTSPRRMTKADRIRIALRSISKSPKRDTTKNAEKIAEEYGRVAIAVFINFGLTSECPRIRKGSVWALHQSFHCPRAAQKGIKKLLRDPDHHVRWHAVFAYREYGEKALDALSVLIELLQDRDSSVREFALDTIGNIGPKAARAVEPIIACMMANNFSRRKRSEDCDNIRSNGAEALGKIRAKPTKSVPMLRKLLTHRNHFVRNEALGALARFGKSALPALDEMVSLLDVPNVWVNAGENIAALGEPAFPRLINALHQGADVDETIKGLRVFGVVRSANAILDRSAQDPRFKRRVASKTLAALGPKAVQIAVNRASRVKLAA